MSYQKPLLAKSVVLNPVLLIDHLQAVGAIASQVATQVGLDPICARYGGWLHDTGKADPRFQAILYSEKRLHSLFPSLLDHPRHEITSLAFLSLFPDAHHSALIDMVVAHHKSLQQDARHRGLLDFIEEYGPQRVFEYHTLNWEDWSGQVIALLNQLGMSAGPISQAQAIKTLYQVLDYCKNRPNGWSKWRGVLMAADHYVSALSEDTMVKNQPLFIPPDLHKFNRPDALYSLSQLKADDPRPHTLVTAPTGAGKTDFLMRRCQKRVFYLLPFQASINAMYERIKSFLPPATDIRAKHAASRILVSKTGVHDEGALQSLVGASIKITTPHQLASIILGTHSYEAMALDLMNSDVILDEIHVYSEQTLAMVVDLVKMLLSLNCRIHIGTATMPSALYQQLFLTLGEEAKVHEIKLSQQSLIQYDRHIVHKHQNWEEVQPILDQAIKNQEKILVVVNRVNHAQELFKQLEKDYPDTPMLLIHSRYKRGDRAEQERKLYKQFANASHACIVVATQVVEVSLDISFDRLITQCAPLDALIQRFGRIHRIRTDQTIGTYKPVHILAPPESSRDCLPYKKEILEQSFAVLPDGQLLHETDIQSRIDQVYPSIDVPAIDLLTIWDGDRCKLKELTHHGSSVLAEMLDIDAITSILEKDKEAYLQATYDQKMTFEIPLSWSVTRHKTLSPYFHPERQLRKVGSWPFILPDELYDARYGLQIKEIDNFI